MGDPRQDLIKLFPKQFEGIVILPGEYDMDMKPDWVLVQLPVRNVSESKWKAQKKSWIIWKSWKSSPESPKPQNGPTTGLCL